MVYAFLKVWANWVLRLFFKKIYVSGLEHLPKDKAILIASNHPNGFLEPITMACIFPRALHFLVRGDVFANPIARFWLEQTNQIPIFRFKDGFSDLRKNNKSIAEAQKKLKQKEAILIFVEGSTESDKQLRPLQKGLSRIAFQVLAQDESLPLDIVPVGINYLDSKRFRSESILTLGPAISANEYYAQHEDHNKGIRKLTADISDAMQPYVVHLDDLKDTQLLNEVLVLSNVLKPNASAPIVTRDSEPLALDNKLVEHINHWDEAQKNDAKSKLKSFFQKHDREALANMYQKPWPTILNLLLLILAAPFAIVGLLINAVPFFAARKFASGIKKKVFFMSLWLSIYAILALVFYMIAVLVLCMIFGWKGLIILVGIPCFSITMMWWDRWKQLRANNKLGNIDNVKSEIKALFQELKINI